MEFLVLGPLEVRDGGRIVPLGGTKERALLALLLLRAGEVISRDRLIDELWAGEPPLSAVSVLQTYMSHLRKAVGRGVIRTRGGGYVVELGSDELDLQRFERLVEEANGAPPEVASALLGEALALWRGPALADFAYEPFAQPEIARLEELRLMAQERRIEADLAVGRHAELVGQLEALVSRHPLRERSRELLMVALYRSGRQAEALEAYQDARRSLVDGLGIEPSRSLQELERAILRHDPALDQSTERQRWSAAARLDAGDREPPAPGRSILVVPRDDDVGDALVGLAVALARRPPRELILVRLVESGADLESATTSLAERRDALIANGIEARIAAFTSSDSGRDIVRVASEQPTDLVLLDAPSPLLETGTIDPDLRAVLAEAPCDVALVFTRGDADLAANRPVTVPFTGAEHDWAAIEIAAWMSRSLGAPLRLLGTAADPSSGRRDASRLLAHASLMVQQVVGIVTEPKLVEAGDRSLIAASEDASLLVLGLSSRWREEGLGEVRLAVTRQARPPTLLVRRGLRPGGLAPDRSVTRFSWTFAEETPDRD